ncbi:hypothetical protein P168DRAFT_290473 [Aspergillus campestris IBT 28561]|uniref:BTB domain-containing protein n=1 Tax=Aspergillus campestris (strain IBT 28561) TaxID=1392248 RepID=A0A2I1D3F4_ASPC2|nr:uncharacterized protein P168DRAFT_290473 [Aspergillus campestris IBT 28561]PKY04407.1 hypothetical protein P168DRAFT_290473 [Aspergillus campestris IBT 28561]
MPPQQQTSSRLLSSRRQLQSSPDSFSSKYGAGKATRSRRILLRDPSGSRRLERRQMPQASQTSQTPQTPPDETSLTPAVVTISVGPGGRLFAAHRDILCLSPYFATVCAQSSDSPGGSRISLPNEQPEVLSCILEFLYKGDYSPRLLRNRRYNTWELEGSRTDSEGQSSGATIFHHAAGAEILRDTAIYCSAQKYGLENLKRLALRKQGLHCGISCDTILNSARYAYAHTPDDDSNLRAQYLALIIGSRSTFKRSGTMQMEMERGGKLFFDLFVAMCNHMDDTEGSRRSRVGC